MLKLRVNGKKNTQTVASGVTSPNNFPYTTPKHELYTSKLSRVIAEKGDIDVVIDANRYVLLDQYHLHSTANRESFAHGNFAWFTRTI